MTHLLDSTPALDGYAMPAEWSPQRRIWMAWPGRPDNWRERALPAQRAWASVANLISEYEPVTMGASLAALPAARRLLSGAVELVELDTDDAWMRDIGPAFVRHVTGGVRAVDWRFNAWGGLSGGLYDSWEADECVAARVAALAGVDRYRAPLVLEGGSIHVDGEGCCLTTEECLLNPNRNPELSRGQIEQHLRDYLGVRTVLWLGRGLLNDETDGHIDNLCCFLRPGVVALAWSVTPDDPQHAISLDALARLAGARDARGRALEVVKLPVPRTPLCLTADEAGGLEPRPGTRPRCAGERLAASYVNFVLLNGAVLVPAFDDPHDALARDVLTEQFPGRRVHQLPGREILLGGGNFHCITQQEPAAQECNDAV